MAYYLCGFIAKIAIAKIWTREGAMPTENAQRNTKKMQKIHLKE